MNSEAEFVWMDGELVKWKEAVVHITASVLQYGIGVFEGIMAYESKENLDLFRLPEHLNRLFDSATIYRMAPLYTREDLTIAIKDVIKANNLKATTYVRPIIYKGVATLGLKKVIEAPTHTAIIASRHGTRLLEDKMEKNRYMISSWKRMAPDSMPLLSKCTANYANAFLALTEAREAGYDGVIMLDHRGCVSEAGSANIFMLKNETLITPPLHASILEGITRDTLMVLAEDLGISVRERDICRSELYTMDEVFVCGTGGEIIPIVQIDNVVIGDRICESTTKRMRTYYHQVVTGKIEKYRKWLTPIY